MVKLFGSSLQTAYKKILLKGYFFHCYLIYICRPLNFINVVYRPTATELLKHPIFKKAKDKKYLQSTLIAIGPSLETRVQKVHLFKNRKQIQLQYFYIFVLETGTKALKGGEKMKTMKLKLS